MSDTHPEQGILYIVATPIGNMADMVPRAVEILQAVDVIAAEDTRHSARLLQHFSITTPMLAYHDFSAQDQTQKLLGQLSQGRKVALISDAGTPLISDPGYPLVNQARLAGYQVSPIPGACALTTALSASGLPCDRFSFEGFLPAKQEGRVKVLHALSEESRTLVFYESPHRITRSLVDIQTCFGSDRRMVLARELTKKFETFLSGSVAQVAQWVNEDANQQKGEFVLMIEGFAGLSQDKSDKQARSLLEILLAELSIKQAVRLACKLSGQKKNKLYALALSMQSDAHTE